MAVDRAPVVDRNFSAPVAALAPGPSRNDLDSPMSPSAERTARNAMRLFESQLQSRHLDLAARWLKSRGTGFYTIGWSGHMGNAAGAAAQRPTEPAFPHHRSGAFFMERARQVTGQRAWVA